MTREEFEQGKKNLEEKCITLWNVYENQEKEYKKARDDYKNACDDLWRFINETIIV